MANFMYIPASDGKEFILNLDAVRMVDQIGPQRLRLFFSEQHIVNLTGDMATEVIALLARNCIVSSGMPLPEFMERVRSQEPSSASPQDSTPEA